MNTIFSKLIFKKSFMEKASATDFDKIAKRHFKLSFFWGLVSILIVYLSSLNSWYAIITLIICIGSIRKYKAAKIYAGQIREGSYKFSNKE